MKVLLFAIKDNLTHYLPPFQAESVAVAERQLEAAIKQGNVPYLKDCALYQLGTYEIETGVIEGKVEFIRNCIDYEGK